ncbi:MAG TPA: leucine-rich repeat protein [Candidatus Saccharimonadaceae bacterium]|nr:leucine-rich repeat protein [Candidatus Saccharimonadaceae bacterium]
MRVIIARRIGLYNVIIAAGAALLLVAGIFAVTVGLQRNSYAAAVPDSCFTFNSGTGAIEDYNATPDPLCLDDVTIPATIGGTPVTTIAGSAFDNASLTSVEFPSSITTIEANAFQNNTLSAITLAAAGDLSIATSAFSGFSGTTLSISAVGDLTISAAISSMPNVTDVSFVAGDDLLLNQGGFTGLTLDNLTLESGLTLTVTDGYFSGTSIAEALSIDGGTAVTLQSGAFTSFQLNGSLSIISGGDITMLTGGLTMGGGTATTVLIDAVGTITTNSSGLAGITAASITIDAGQDIDMRGGSMTGFSADTVTVTAGQDIYVLSSFYGDTGLLTMTAGGAMNLDASMYVGAIDTTYEVVLESGTGLMLLENGVFADNDELTSMTITAPSGLSLEGGSIWDLIALSELNLTLGGDVLFTTGALQNSIITDLTIVTDGSMTINSGGLGPMPFLESITIDVGVDIVSNGSYGDYPALTSVDYAAGGDISIGSGTFFDSPLVETASFIAGGALTFEGWVLGENQLSDLTLESDGPMTIGGGAFFDNQLTVLRLPSTLVSIGDTAFMANKLEAVYLAGTPTIGEAVFTMNGATYNPGGANYINTDQISYVPIYTTNPANPAGYVDTVDGANGGYIINPASYTLTYTAGGDTLLPSTTPVVGELGDGTLLTSYLIADNEDGLNAYYRPGDVLSFSAPAIDGYITPDPIELTLSANLNTFSFVYEPILAGVPNTGFGRVESPQLLGLIVAGVVGLTGAGLMAYAVIRRK